MVRTPTRLVLDPPDPVDLYFPAVPTAFHQHHRTQDPDLETRHPGSQPVTDHQVPEREESSFLPCPVSLSEVLLEPDPDWRS
jgi:hypothetical protein